MQSVTTKVKPIPEGYHSLTPILTVEGATSLISFLKEVFDAKEEEVYKGPDGRVVHAELTIGDSIVMISDENPQFPAFGNMIKSTPKMLTPHTSEHSLQARHHYENPRTSSMETGPLESRTSTATSGGWQPTSKMFLGKN